VTSKKVPTDHDAPLHSEGEEPPVAENPVAASAVRSWQEDLRLMTSVAAGDVAAMNLVAKRLTPRVRRLSRLIVKNDTWADDAAQIAIVEILESARTYGGRSSLERWADRITARITLRHVKEERRRFHLAEPIEDAESNEVLSVEHDPTEDARAETPRPMDEYLRSLPEVQREALVLKHSFGYTVEEIAELTSVPVGTVKDRLVTARRQLRRLIQRDLTLGLGRGKQS
jgi:RNA polymerase sigma-70 factor (ECF subfamily)